VRAWVVYSVLRVGLFLVLFALLFLLNVAWWVAAFAAALIALCISYIFFGKLRGRVAEELEARRAAAADPALAQSDEGAEDALDSGREGERGSES
jgi:ABC-type bacteriocin/lantibiotic exporter with double-glycine peptidase domain